MGQRRGSARTSGRLFLSYAALMALPVALLAVALAGTYRGEANRRGLAEGRSEAVLIAQTAVQPLLADRPVTASIGQRERADLLRLVVRSVRTHDILRLRIRDLQGNVVFSDDGSGFRERPEDEALDAAHGATVARLTRFNSDANDSGPVGPEAVEVYLPLVEGSPPRDVAVLELYLPYAPIRADVTAGLHDLYLDLAAGLTALYALLVLISWSVTRRLRDQVRANAFLAEHDRLTGLENRAVFRKRTRDALATNRERGGSTTIALIDLDNFRELNDALGHDNGDRVLVEIARRLSTEFASSCVVSHFGGDEFGLVIDGPSAGSRLEDVRQLIGREIEIVGLPITVEANVGFIVVAPEDGDVDVDLLLQHADVALFQAKARHSGIAPYEAAADHFDAANLELIADLRRAIVAGELVLHYQPQFGVVSGHTVAVEALVRWNHPSRGLLAPDEFIPLAERTDLINDLTDWVIGRALEEIGGPNTEGNELGLSVNVSARSLGNADFAERVLSSLGASDVAANRLTIEITETALLEDPVHASMILVELEAAGISISLDDFGTGQTSLSYLSSLPVHELKVDKGFVLKMLSDHSQGAIVRSIVDLGHNLGMAVVAEGVETTAILDALERIGCDRAQGYLVARPMPVEQLREWIRSERASRLVSVETSAPPRRN